MNEQREMTAAESWTHLTGVLNSLMALQTGEWREFMHDAVVDAMGQVTKALERAERSASRLACVSNGHETLQPGGPSKARVIAESLVEEVSGDDGTWVALDHGQNYIPCESREHAANLRTALVDLMAKAIDEGLQGTVPAARYAEPHERASVETNEQRARRYEANISRVLEPELVQPISDESDGPHESAPQCCLCGCGAREKAGGWGLGRYIIQGKVRVICLACAKCMASNPRAV